jgi:competence protein ComEC
MLARHDVSRLDAVFVTHDQLDHAGGLNDLVGRVPFDRLVLARPAPRLESMAGAVGAEVDRVSEGDTFALGPAELTALWPPAGGTIAGADPDPNASSLVLALEHDGWRALLTGDAEAEATGLDPGPFDLLKVAHHGSADAGLERLLDRSAPRVALVGVGAGNPHGHPTPETLASLEERGICVLRTDLDGELWADLGPGGLRAGSERNPAACESSSGT